MKNYIITQLTQTSTWYGLIIILAALLLPKSWIVVLGLLVLVTDDTKINKFFLELRTDLQKWWKA